MRIDFDDAKRGPIPWSETLKVEAKSLGSPDIVALGRIDASCVLTFAEPNYRLRGSLKYQQMLSCYRCLAEIESEVDDDFEYSIERRRPKRQVDEGDDDPSSRKPSDKPAGEVELARGDLEVVVVESDHIDPNFFVREQILLQLPMKPLCRPDCQGLCSRCGTDLNSGRCQCKAPVADPRWASLESLKSQLEE